MCREGEPATILDDRNRKARKPHACSECGRVIQRGEIYHFQVYIVEGYIYRNKTCAHCQIPREWLSTNCGMYIFGDVLDDIAEHIQEYPDLAMPLGALADGMRKKWDAGGTLMPLPQQAPAITV